MTSILETYSRFLRRAIKVMELTEYFVAVPAHFDARFVRVVESGIPEMARIEWASYSMRGEPCVDAVNVETRIFTMSEEEFRAFLKVDEDKRKERLRLEKITRNERRKMAEKYAIEDLTKKLRNLKDRRRRAERREQNQ